MGQIRKSSSVGPAGGIYDLGMYRTRVNNAATATAVEASDQAGISESARELSRAHAEVSAAPETRTALIMQLKTSIANGSYNPDPREIARSILERGLY